MSEVGEWVGTILGDDCEVATAGAAPQGLIEGLTANGISSSIMSQDSTPVAKAAMTVGAPKPFLS